MPVISKKSLLKQGFTREDIDLGLKVQAAQLRAGSPPRSLAQVLRGQPAVPRPDAAADDLTQRQLKRRGRYGQAALLMDQQAMAEPDLETAQRVREYSTQLKHLARIPEAQEFNFFMGNTTTGHQYFDTITQRLVASSDVTTGERMAALAALSAIIRHLGWQSHTCEKSASELAALLGLQRASMTRTIQMLERVGAITRISTGRTKRITVTPAGAYRGRISQHPAAVDAYQAAVVQLRPIARVAAA